MTQKKGVLGATRTWFGESPKLGNTQTKEGDLVTIRAKALCKSKPRKITQGHNTIHGITVKVGQKSIEEF